MASAQSDPILRHIRKLVAAQDKRNLSDRELLSQFAVHHDDGAFEALVGRHGPMVLRLCQRVLDNPHDAEDVFQATFLILGQQAASRRWRDSLANWLYKVAYHLALNARTAAARRCAHEKGALSKSSGDPLAEITGRELLAVLDQELARLPEKYRAPLVLCHLQGHTRDEAAQRLGCPLGTLKSRLERGRELLRKSLAHRGLTLTAALLAGLLSPSGSPAGVPTGLVRATVQAALALLGSKATAGIISTPVAALMQGWLRAMIMTKVNFAVIWLVLGLAIAGTGLLAQRILAPKEKPPTTTDQQKTESKVADQTRPGKEIQARTDLYGDSLPDRTIARVGIVRFRHGSQVYCVAFSPDGRLIASGSFHGELCLWDRATGKLVRRFLEPHKENSIQIVTTVAFSPDGRILASNKGKARLWDVRSGKLLRDLDESLFGPVCSMAFSPDGKTLALATVKGVWLYDLATGKAIRPFPGHTESLRAVGFSKDGKVLASGSIDKTVRIWDLATGKEIHRFEPHDSIVHVALAPDGNLLAAQTTKEVLLWEVTTGREVRRFQAERQLRSLAFSPDGSRLASANLIWDVTTGKEVCRLAGLPTSGLAWEGDKTLVWVTGGAGSMVSGALAFAPDGTVLATGGYDGVVRLHDPATGKELPQVKNFPWNRGTMNLCDFAPDGRWLAVRDSGGIHLCETTSGREIHRLPMGDDHGASLVPLPVALAPDGRTVLAAGAEAIYQWDTTTGKELRRIPRRKREDEKPMAALAFAPDGQTFACAHYEPTIRLWDKSSGKQLREFQGDQNGVYHLFFFPDGKRLVSESLNHTVRIWDLTTGKELRQWRLQSGCVQAFSADGKIAAVDVTESNKPALALCDLASGKELRRIAIQAAEGGGFQDARSVYCAFSPDGRLLAVDADPVYYPDHKRTTQLLEVVSGKVRARFAGHFGFPGPMMFSPDGKMLATGSSDTTALIWDVTGRMNEERLRTEPLTAESLKTLWTDLGADNAHIAHRAIWALAAAPDQAVPLLKEKLPPVQRDIPPQVTRMIEELDGNQFAARAKAAAELEKLGDIAEPALRQTLARNPSLEVRRRIEQLLGKLDVAPERLQKLRAVEVLEHIATPEARELLLALAQDAPEAWLTQEAKASLERLNKRAPVKPRSAHAFLLRSLRLGAS